MSTSTQTETISSESILEAAGIPLSASIHDISWNENGNLQLEWTESG